MSEATPSKPPAAPERAAANSASEPPKTRHRRRRWLIAAVLFLAAVAGGCAFYYYTHRPRDTSRIVLEGNIDVRQVNLAFKVDGRIESLAVDEGDPVKEGQVIATLDKRYFDDELDLARARRDNAAAVLARLEHGSRPEEIAEAKAETTDREAALVRAKANFARAEELIGSGGMSKEEFDSRRTALQEAEAKLASARQAQRLAEIGPRQEDIDAARAQLAEQNAMVVQSERRLADSKLVAPNDGIILTRARERGAIVQAGETVYALTLDSPVWVRTYVNEKDLGRIRPNMAARVRTDSAPGKVYRGFIGFISPTAEFTPKTVETREIRTDLVYRLRVIVANPDGGLRQGMPVTVILYTGGGVSK